MANSTFSGPVRSQNGFQELVNGVWVPVGGGGGGSTLIVPAGGNETYTLNFTEVGQMITVVAQAVPGTLNGLITLNATVPGGAEIKLIDGVVIHSATVTLQSTLIGFPHTFNFLSGGGMFLQFVYTGTFEEPYGPTAYFKINGYAPF